MIELRLGKKTAKCGIGQRKDPTAPRKQIRLVSPKQAKRTDALQENFERVMQVQCDFYGTDTNFCEAGHGEWKTRCPNNKNEFKLKLVPGHVIPRARRGPDIDKHKNLQVLCSWCNWFQGSRVIDFRPPAMVEKLKELDQ